MRHWYVLLLFITNLSWAQVYTLESTPNPKVTNNSYVSDPAHILDTAVVASINHLLDSLEKKTTAQIAVVLLPSIGGTNVFDFSQALFKKWGIGQQKKDNGLLILFVNDKRIIRFHTGLGLEGLLPDVVCKRIQREHMVPYFKKKDYATGIVQGVKEVARILSDPESAKEIYDSETSDNNGSLLVTVIVIAIIYFVGLFCVFAFQQGDKKFTPSPEIPRVTISIWWWRFLYIMLPAAFFLYHASLSLSFWQFIFRFYLLFIFLFVERFVRVMQLAKPFVKAGRQHELYNYLQEQKLYWRVFSFVFPLPVIAFHYILLKKANSYRNEPRPCKKCGTLQEKLSEDAEDFVLNPGQQEEEKLKSVDYDVWKCNSCGSTEILNYINADTKYKSCSKCSYVSSSLSETRTLTPATYSSEGSGEEEYICTNCGHHTIVPIVIAVLTQSSSSSDSSSSSSSSSDSGSFGGGDSGGGGADSSW